MTSRHGMWRRRNYWMPPGMKSDPDFEKRERRRLAAAYEARTGRDADVEREDRADARARRKGWRR